MMADSKPNKGILKIVWLPGEDEIIFNAKLYHPHGTVIDNISAEK